MRRRRRAFLVMGNKGKMRPVRTMQAGVNLASEHPSAQPRVTPLEKGTANGAWSGWSASEHSPPIAFFFRFVLALKKKKKIASREEIASYGQVNTQYATLSVRFIYFRFAPARTTTRSAKIARWPPARGNSFPGVVSEEGPRTLAALSRTHHA